MTQEFLRPDADDSVGNWTTQAGGTSSLYLTIDETVADDADYVKSGTNPSSDVYKVRMSNPSASVGLPSGGVWTIYGSTPDGCLSTFGGASYSTADSGAGASVELTNALIIARCYDGSNYIVGQGFVQFDTSSVSGTPHTVEMSLCRRSTSGWFDSGIIGTQSIELLSYDWGSTLEGGDWIASSGFSGKQTSSSLSFTSSSTLNQYYAFPSTAGLIGAIGNAGSGITRLVVVDANQANTPTDGVDENDGGFYSSEIAGTTQDPYLYIDSSANPIYVRYRYWKRADTATGSINLTVKLLEGVTEIASWSHTGIGFTAVTAEQSLTEAQGASVTDWTNLYLSFTATAA